MFKKDLIKQRKKYKFLKLREQNYHCFYCRKILTDGNATYDHIVPISENGSEDYGNFVVACQKCNGTRGSMEFGLFCNIVTSEEDLESYIATNRAMISQNKKARMKEKKEKIKKEKDTLKINYNIANRKYNKAKNLLALIKKQIDKYRKLSDFKNMFRYISKQKLVKTIKKYWFDIKENLKNVINGK